MSGIGPGITKKMVVSADQFEDAEPVIKKKMLVSADQFEDADEDETEDFLGAAASAASKPEEPPTSVAGTKLGTLPLPFALKIAQRVEKESPSPARSSEFCKESSIDVEADGYRGESTSPAQPRTLTNPLDALASACVVKEQSDQLKVKMAEPKASKDGTKILAEDISCTDVLCGRGGQSNHHPGNIFFRRLVRAKQEEYLKANKREKTVVAKDIVRLIRMLTPPGRFLKKKDEKSYVDVGDNMARNKASQALREGAPELREELRDQHSRLNVERGGGPEVNLPYHTKSAQGTSDEGTEAERTAMIRKEREELAMAAARGQVLAPYGAPAEGFAGSATGLRGQADPPDGSDDEAESVSAAAMHAAAEERARRLMLASGGAPPGLGGHFLGPHLGLGGLGAAASLNPYLAGHPSAAAQFELAALQAAGGPHLFSQQALMMGQPSAAALLQASRAREYAHFEAAMSGGINPLLLGAQRAAAGQAPSFQDSVRLHELMASSGKGYGETKPKRDREEIERELDESYAKAAKLRRDFNR